MQNNNYLQNFLKKHDADRYLISLFVKGDRRIALWALFVFHMELAKTRYLVTETTLGLIRFQWWRDALEEIYNSKNTRTHPVLDQLEIAIRNYGLPKALFENLIYAYEGDLEHEDHGFDLVYIEQMADLTGTPLMKLALQITGGELPLEHVQNTAIYYEIMIKIRVAVLSGEYKNQLLPNFEKYRETKIEKNKILCASQTLAQLYHQQISYALERNKPERLNMPPPFKELRLWLACR